MQASHNLNIQAFKTIPAGLNKPSAPMKHSSVRNSMYKTGLTASAQKPTASMHACSRATLGMSASFGPANAPKISAISKQNNYMGLTSASAISGMGHVSSNRAHMSRTSTLSMLQSGPKSSVPQPRVPPV